MRSTAFVKAAVVFLIGSLVLAGVYWGLLNVPESNVLALLFSAALVVVLAVGIGFTIGTATGAGASLEIGQAVRRATGALPVFSAGLVIFGLLAVATVSFDGWWAAHRGEVDAVAVRYANITATTPLHTAVAWASWLVRWVIGLSFVVALVVASVLRSDVNRPNGLRLAVTALPLGAAAIGVLLVTQGLWRVAPWRPQSLPATRAEVYFSAAKLGLLYLVAVVIATAVLAVYLRSAKTLRRRRVSSATSR